MLELGHGVVGRASPDQHLHLRERGDVGFAVLFQCCIGCLSLGQVEQRRKGFEGLGDAFFSGIDRLLSLQVVFADQKVPGVSGVVAHTGGDHHHRLDFRPVLLDDDLRLLLERRQVVQRV
ncbi:hypothetical protein D3C73_1359160 [compost metagenome]